MCGTGAPIPCPSPNIRLCTHVDRCYKSRHEDERKCTVRRLIYTSMHAQIVLWSGATTMSTLEIYYEIQPNPMHNNTTLYTLLYMIYAYKLRAYSVTWQSGDWSKISQCHMTVRWLIKDQPVSHDSQVTDQRSASVTPLGSSSMASPNSWL